MARVTQKSLLAEITRLRSLVEARASNLESAIEKGKIPKSVRNFGFLGIYYDMMNIQDNTFNRLTGSFSGSKMRSLKPEQKIKTLTAAKNALEKMLSMQTATVAGAKEAVKEREDIARITAKRYGVNTESLNKRQLSIFFNFAELIKTTFDYSSEMSFEKVQELIEKNPNMTIGELYRRFTKKTSSGAREIREIYDELF